MVDYFALAVTHALLALAAWRLLRRDDLDREPRAGADVAGLAPPSAPPPPNPAKLPPRGVRRA